MSILKGLKNFFAVKIISVKCKLSGKDAPIAVYFSEKEKTHLPRRNGKDAK